MTPPPPPPPPNPSSTSSDPSSSLSEASFLSSNYHLISSDSLPEPYNFLSELLHEIIESAIEQSDARQKASKPKNTSGQSTLFDFTSASVAPAAAANEINNLEFPSGLSRLCESATQRLMTLQSQKELKQALKRVAELEEEAALGLSKSPAPMSPTAATGKNDKNAANNAAAAQNKKKVGQPVESLSAVTETIEALQQGVVSTVEYSCYSAFPVGGAGLLGTKSGKIILTQETITNLQPRGYLSIFQDQSIESISISSFPWRRSYFAGLYEKNTQNPTFKSGRESNKDKNDIKNPKSSVEWKDGGDNGGVNLYGSEEFDRLSSLTGVAGKKSTIASPTLSKKSGGAGTGPNTTGHSRANSSYSKVNSLISSPDSRASHSRSGSNAGTERANTEIEMDSNGDDSTDKLRDFYLVSCLSSSGEIQVLVVNPFYSSFWRLATIGQKEIAQAITASSATASSSSTASLNYPGLSGATRWIPSQIVASPDFHYLTLQFPCGSIATLELSLKSYWRPLFIQYYDDIHGKYATEAMEFEFQWFSNRHQKSLNEPWLEIPLYNIAGELIQQGERIEASNTLRLPENLAFSPLSAGNSPLNVQLIGVFEPSESHIKRVLKDYKELNGETKENEANSSEKKEISGSVQSSAGTSGKEKDKSSSRPSSQSQARPSSVTSPSGKKNKTSNAANQNANTTAADSKDAKSAVSLTSPVGSSSSSGSLSSSWSAALNRFLIPKFHYTAAESADFPLEKTFFHIDSMCFHWEMSSDMYRVDLKSKTRRWRDISIEVKENMEKEIKQYNVKTMESKENNEVKSPTAAVMSPKGGASSGLASPKAKKTGEKPGSAGPTASQSNNPAAASAAPVTTIACPISFDKESVITLARCERYAFPHRVSASASNLSLLYPFEPAVAAMKALNSRVSNLKCPNLIVMGFENGELHVFDPDFKVFYPLAADFHRFRVLSLEFFHPLGFLSSSEDRTLHRTVIKWDHDNDRYTAAGARNMVDMGNWLDRRSHPVAHSAAISALLTRPIEKILCYPSLPIALLLYTAQEPAPASYSAIVYDYQWNAPLASISLPSSKSISHLSPQNSLICLQSTPIPPNNTSNLLYSPFLSLISSVYPHFSSALEFPENAYYPNYFAIFNEYSPDQRANRMTFSTAVGATAKPWRINPGMEYFEQSSMFYHSEWLERAKEKLAEESLLRSFGVKSKDAKESTHSRSTSSLSVTADPRSALSVSHSRSPSQFTMKTNKSDRGRSMKRDNQRFSRDLSPAQNTNQQKPTELQALTVAIPVRSQFAESLSSLDWERKEQRSASQVSAVRSHLSTYSKRVALNAGPKFLSSVNDSANALPPLNHFYSPPSVTPSPPGSLPSSLPLAVRSKRMNLLGQHAFFHLKADREALEARNRQARERVMVLSEQRRDRWKAQVTKRHNEKIALDSMRQMEEKMNFGLDK